MLGNVSTDCGEIAYGTEATLEYVSPSSVVTTFQFPLDTVGNEIVFTLDKPFYDTLIGDYGDFATFAASPTTLNLKFTGSLAWKHA